MMSPGGSQRCDGVAPEAEPGPAVVDGAEPDGGVAVD